MAFFSPGLTHQPQLPLSLSPSRTVVTSFQPKCQSYEEGDWVLCLATTTATSGATPVAHNESVAVALSNGEVQVYDPHRLHRVSTFQTARQVQSGVSFSASCIITDLKYHPLSSSSDDDHRHPYLLWATTSSGGVHLYDVRQQTAAAAVSRVQVPLASEGAWAISLGYGGTVAAIAGHKRIRFLDVRKLTDAASSSPQGSVNPHHALSPWLGCYKDAHSDRVSSVLFVGESSSTLVSGGEDGLVSIFDTSQQSESDALQCTWNVGSPVRKVGVAMDASSPSTGLVWCLTGSETLGLWNPDSDAVLRFPDLRQDLNARGSMGVHHPPTLPAVDYVVDAQWDRNSHSLLLAAGNSRGDSCIYRLSLLARAGTGSQEHPQHPSARWEPLYALTGGHRGVVRSWVRFSNSVMLTSGEDARLCEWKIPPQEGTTAASPASSAAATPTAPPPSLHSRSSAGVGGRGVPVRRQRNRPNLGPY
jgi:WD40 repeat protein